MSIDGLEAFFAYMAVSWHWMVALIICMLVRGAVKGAFARWSAHRIALAKARRPKMLQPPAGQPALPGPAKLVECKHYAPDVVAVINETTSEREAWLCRACNTQLPATWAIGTQDG